MHTYIHSVKYYETDKMGITHHSNYVRWMEEARTDFLKNAGYGIRRLEKEGVIGSVYPYLLTTTGNSTSVADATKFGQEMAEDLLAAGVNGVILTST